jgi:hypothetical protein
LVSPHYPSCLVNTTNTPRYSFVFPNTGLVTASLAIGISLESEPIKIFGTVLAALVVIVWVVVFLLMIQALWERTLLWPGKITGGEAMRRRWLRVGGEGDKYTLSVPKFFRQVGRRMSS